MTIFNSGRKLVAYSIPFADDGGLHELLKLGNNSWG
jgi:hypothetical protein